MAEEPLPVDDEPAPPADVDASSEEPTSTEEQDVSAAPETETDQEPTSDESPTSTLDPADAEDVDFAFGKIGIDRTAFDKLHPESQQAFVALAKQYRETNNRAGEYAKQAKEAARAARPTLPPEIDSSRQAAPPTGDELKREITERVRESVGQDQLCQSWRAEWHQNNTANQEAATKLANMDYEISRIAAALDAETFKKLGLEYPYDEFQTRQMKDRLYDMRQDRRDLKDQADARAARNRALSDAFDKRSDQYRDHFKGQYEATSREEEERREIETVQRSFTEEWKAGLAKAYKDLGIPNDAKLRRRLDLKARVAARATVLQAPIDEGKVADFLITAMREEIEDGKLWTTHKMVQYAKDKLADASSPAPPGKASIAAKDPRQGPDWRARFNANKEALMKKHPKLFSLG
jgi:hypothetical protein